MHELPEGAKKFNKKRRARSKSNYLAETSRIDQSSYFTGFDFLLKTGVSGSEFAEKLSDLKERIEQFEEQRSFVLKVLPELIHDIRSPLVSMVGFGEVFGNKAGDTDLAKEFSGCVREDGKLAIKRLEGLEELIQSFLKAENHTLKDCSISEMVEWVIAVFGMKIRRKCLEVIREFDEELLEKKFSLDSRSTKILLFEIFHNIIKFARNRDKLVIKGKKTGNDIILTVKLSSPRKTDEKESIKKLLPGFMVNKVKTRILSDPGYQVIISPDEVG